MNSEIQATSISYHLQSYLLLYKAYKQSKNKFKFFREIFIIEPTYLHHVRCSICVFAKPKYCNYTV